MSGKPGAEGNLTAPDCVPGLVSIIIPTYNREELLRQALDSARAMTYENWECLVIDDGSTDGTESMVASRIEKDGGERLRYIKQENLGAPSARNAGMAASRGEFIHFLDSDDLLSRTGISARAKIMEETGAAVGYGPSGYIDPQGDELYLRTDPYETCPLPEGVDMLSGLLRGRVMIPSRSLYRRSALAGGARWDPELVRWQDLDFAYQVAASKPALAFSDEPIAYFRTHNDGRLSARADAEAVASARRVLSRLEEMLEGRGLLDDYREDLACSYAVWAMAVAGQLEQCSREWIGRSKELGAASMPFAGRLVSWSWRPLGRSGAWRVVRLVEWMRKMLGPRWSRGIARIIRGARGDASRVRRNG